MSDQKQPDTKALNKEHEDKVVAAQWDLAKREGLLDNPVFGDAINENKPADTKE